MDSLNEVVMDGDVGRNTRWPSGDPSDLLMALGLAASFAFVFWIVLQH
jgi:hypothetical protein